MSRPAPLVVNETGNYITAAGAATPSTAPPIVGP